MSTHTHYIVPWKHFYTNYMIFSCTSLMISCTRLPHIPCTRWTNWGVLETKAKLYKPEHTACGNKYDSLDNRSGRSQAQRRYPPGIWDTRSAGKTRVSDEGSVWDKTPQSFRNVGKYSRSSASKGSAPRTDISSQRTLLKRPYDHKRHIWTWRFDEVQREHLLRRSHWDLHPSPGCLVGPDPMQNTVWRGSCDQLAKWMDVTY